MIEKPENRDRVSERRSLLIPVFCVLLSALAGGCGFHPLYARSEANPGAQRIFGSIFVDPIESETAGYELRNTLIDLLQARASPNNATYRLDVTLTEKRGGIVEQNEVVAGVNETDITRYNYSLVADYKLLDAKGNVVTKGTSATLAAYNVVNSPYSTLIGQQDAYKRAADDVAQRIRLDLGVFFANGGKTP